MSPWKSCAKLCKGGIKKTITINIIKNYKYTLHRTCSAKMLYIYMFHNQCWCTLQMAHIGLSVRESMSLKVPRWLALLHAVNAAGLYFEQRWDAQILHVIKPTAFVIAKRRYQRKWHNYSYNNSIQLLMSVCKFSKIGSLVLGNICNTPYNLIHNKTMLVHV